MSKIAVPDHLMRLPKPGSSPDDRMPPMTPEQMTPAQKVACEEFEKERGMGVGGPFVPLSRSPEVLRMATHIGKYLRTQSPVPTRLSELATLITARRWSQSFELYAHEKIAGHAGLGGCLRSMFWATASARRCRPCPRTRASECPAHAAQ